MMYQGIDTKPDLIEIDKEKEKQARENHCEIERRRRVKMAAYFNELCSMVPTCNTLQRKPDKLTILRMASSHMRQLRASNQQQMLANNPNMMLMGANQSSSNDSPYKPSFLTDQELKHLILEAADGFLFVAQCDSGNIIYVSDAIQPVLCYNTADWYHHSLFEFVHVDDMEKVKDQLASNQESSGQGRILDLKTGTVKKESHSSSLRSHLGCRRGFICRMRIGQSVVDPSGNHWNRINKRCNLMAPMADSGSYAVVHVSGYTKAWPPVSGGSHHDLQMMVGDENPAHYCLVAIARIQMTAAPNDASGSGAVMAPLNPAGLNTEFVTKVDGNGVVTFVDQRMTPLLGYETTAMFKKNFAEFCASSDEQIAFQEHIKMLYESKSSQPITLNLHLKASNGEYIAFKTSAHAFCNPYSDEFEFIVCTHSLQKLPNDPTPNIDQNFPNSTYMIPPQQIHDYTQQSVVYPPASGVSSAVQNSQTPNASQWATSYVDPSAYMRASGNQYATGYEPWNNWQAQASASANQQAPQDSDQQQQQQQQPGNNYDINHGYSYLPM